MLSHAIDWDSLEITPLTEEQIGDPLPLMDEDAMYDFVFYDREDPPMKEGTIYTSMDEFRSVVRQHGIKEQFELGTEKSYKKLFRGYCKAKGYPWSIIARLMRDQQQVRVLTPF